MARAVAPDLLEHDDIMEFNSTAAGGRQPQAVPGTLIHGSLYAKRPDVQAVVHSHSHSVIPFSVTQARLRPLLHSSGILGKNVPVWDAQDSFGDTNLLIASERMGADFAEVLDSGTGALRRGHGSTVVAVRWRGDLYSRLPESERQAATQRAAWGRSPSSAMARST